MIQIAYFQLGIRSRLPREGEIPLAVLIDLHECQCGKIPLILHQRTGINPFVLQCLFQKISVHIGSNLPDKGSPVAHMTRHGEQIRRCSAGVLLEQLHSVFADARFGKIDQQFSQSYDCNLFFHSKSTCF